MQRRVGEAIETLRRGETMRELSDREALAPALHPRTRRSGCRRMRPGRRHFDGGRGDSHGNGLARPTPSSGGSSPRSVRRSPTPQGRRCVDSVDAHDDLVVGAVGQLDPLPRLDPHDRAADLLPGHVDRDAALVLLRGDERLLDALDAVGRGGGAAATAKTSASSGMRIEEACMAGTVVRWVEKSESIVRQHLQHRPEARRGNSMTPAHPLDAGIGETLPALRHAGRARRVRGDAL